jgi:hypothetical protein
MIAVRVVQADRGDLVDRAGPDLVGLVAIRDPADPVDLAVRLPVDRMDLAVRMVRAGLADIRDPADPVDLPGQGDRVDRVDLAGPADPDPGLADLPAPVGPADPVDWRRSSGSPRGHSTVVARRWAARGTRRAASAHPATVRHLRRYNTAGAGTTGPRLASRRVTGTDRRLQVDGTVLRRRVVGTTHGRDRHAISRWRNAISGRSITTTMTPSRCSVRSSADGASGLWESGSRCTDAA